MSNDWMIQWKTIALSLCFGALATGHIWIISQIPWVGVFTMGVFLGIYIQENWKLVEELKVLQENSSELEKQVVSLKTALHNIILLKEKNGSSSISESRSILNNEIKKAALSRHHKNSQSAIF
jgi:hypothetical protein